MSAAANPRVERVEAAGQAPASVGESPVWRVAEQALYWVDIPAQKIVRLHVDSGKRSEWRLPEKVACIAFDQRGTVLAGCETGLFAVALTEGSADGEPVQVTGRKLAAPEGRRDWPLSRYSPERLFSVEARLAFIPPDRPSSTASTGLP